jgi:ABC-type Fe3+/spermidine/putrescine transport system ATPase subunit
VQRGTRRVLDGVSLSVQPGERLAVHGPSGCGKTTLLYAIAGLVDIERGAIRISDRDVTTTPAHQRDIGLVFQDNQLFPHFDVADNVSYSLRVRGMAKRERRNVAEEWLSRFGLTGLAHRRVTELSGGEAKRVALARTMAGKPRVVLLDEPLTGLDDHLHEQLLADIRSVFDRLGTTVVHVTHDRAEGAALCHRSMDLAPLG